MSENLKAGKGSSQPRYSIVIPCFNEQDCIVALVAEIAALVRGDDNFELIVIDDCSNDETQARLREARDQHKINLRLISHSVNSGQSAAICSGVDAARGDWIVTLDGDGQNDPADIPALIRMLESYDGLQTPIICGHRTKRHDSVVRRLSSRIANGVRQALLHDMTPDTGCGLKIIQRAAFQRLPQFDHMHRFLPALVQRDGGVVISAPVGHRPRMAGQSKYGINNRLWVGLIDLLGVMWLRRQQFKTKNYEEY